VILRVLNFVVIGALVLAAAYVYRIKFEATVQAERLAKLRDELRHERDRIAALRARWGELDDPARMQDLTQRFLKLKPVEPTQFDTLDRLPVPPPDYMRPGSSDPIGGMIEHLDGAASVTGSISAPRPALGTAAAAAPAANSGEASAPPRPTAPSAIKPGFTGSEQPMSRP
jgi:hypothetical protein